MMFITPMPPSESVTSAMKPRKTVIESKMPATCFWSSTVSQMPSALLSAGLKSCARRDHFLHLQLALLHTASSDRG